MNGSINSSPPPLPPSNVITISAQDPGLYPWSSHFYKGKLRMTMTLAEWDRRLLLTPKLLYFAVGSVYYAFYIFRIQFFKDYYGFDVSQAGDIAAGMTLTGFACTAGWSALADRLKIHRSLLAFLAFLTSAVFELLLLRFSTKSADYWYALGVFAIFGAVLGGLLPLADYQILRLLTEKFKVSRALYGRQRMMGTVSYGLTTLLIGYLIDWKGVTIIFYLLPILSAILIATLLTFGVPDNLFNKQESMELGKPVNGNSHSGGGAGGATLAAATTATVEKPSSMVFFKNGRFLFFLLVVFITGCGRQVLQVYLPPFLKETMKMTSTQAGYAIVSSTIFSIVFLFIGAELIAFFGVYTMLILGMTTMGIRLGCYVFLPHSPTYSWAVYSIELLNGVAFSFTHLAGVKIAADFAPRGLEATSQAIYTSFYMQLPAVLVSTVAGRLYKRLGGVTLFEYSSKLTLISAALVAACYILNGQVRPFGHRST